MTLKITFLASLFSQLALCCVKNNNKILILGIKIYVQLALSVLQIEGNYNKVNLITNKPEWRNYEIIKQLNIKILFLKCYKQALTELAQYESYSLIFLHQCCVIADRMNW